MKNLFTKLSILILVFLLINTQSTFSQVLISGSSGTPDGSAMLEIKSSDKGVLIPRVTTTNRRDITGTAGLIVYDKTIGSFFLYGKKTDTTTGWIDLSSNAEIWQTKNSNVFLSNSNYNVGIGTSTPSKKLVIKATNNLDTLFEIQDQNGNPLMVITPSLTKFNIIKNAKGISGGFAVGRYEAAKAISDTTLFIVTPDSTRVYTSAKSTGISGGFAVGRYEAAKNGGGIKNNFYTDIDSTRVYTSAKSTGISGGFAVGRYEAAKGSKAKRPRSYMYMVPNNYFIGDQSGDSLQTGKYSGKYNTFFGYQTGLNDTVGGSNVFIGYKSGLNNTGDIFAGDTLGSRNVFLGYEAGLNNTVGSDNVLLGYKAGHEVTTAGNNISIGSNAGYKNTNNSDNIFLGRNAGYNHTGISTPNLANNNIFIGFEAGKGSITGGARRDNIFIGTRSDTSIQSGYHNVFLGTETGLHNTTGFYNVYIGYQTGLESETEKYNTFVGHQAGKNTKGHAFGQNTFYGAYAGFNATTGTHNAFFGYNTGASAGAGSENTYIGSFAGLNATGDNNVFLGYHAGSNENGSDKLYIDNSNTSSPLIYGEFDNNYLRIGGTLNINGQYNMPTNSGTNGQVLVTSGSGTASWTTIATGGVTAGNGLHLSGSQVQLGGTLNQNTTVTQGSYSMTYNLSGTGDFNIQDNGTSAFFVRDNGNVGIGTTAPLHSLHITKSVNVTDGTDGNLIDIQNSNTASNVISGIRFRNGTTANTFKGAIFYQDKGTYGTGDMIFANNSSTSAGNVSVADAKMVIKNNGNVGIGTTSPGQPLVVNGDVQFGSNTNYDGDSESILLRSRSDDWVIGAQNETTGGASDFFIGKSFTGDGDGIFHINNDGNIGIGTNNPNAGYKLEVDGDSKGIYAKATSASANYAIVGSATGGSSNYAIYGIAANGSSSFAGYFQGGVKVRGAVYNNMTTKTSDYTITNSDGIYTLLVNSTSARTITLPAASDNNGRILRIKRINTGSVTIAVNGTDTIDNSTSKTINARYKGYILQSDGSNWWVVGIMDDFF